MRRAAGASAARFPCPDRAPCPSLDEVRRVMRPALPGAVEAWPPPANADMSPYGESLATYRGRHRMSPADSHFDVRLHQPAHASAAQRAHHARLQGLALMFIDGTGGLVPASGPRYSRFAPRLRQRRRPSTRRTTAGTCSRSGRSARGVREDALARPPPQLPPFVGHRHAARGGRLRHVLPVHQSICWRLSAPVPGHGPAALPSPR